MRPRPENVGPRILRLLLLRYTPSLGHDCQAQNTINKLKPNTQNEALTVEKEWLSNNLEHYEATLLHALMHDPEYRKLILPVSLVDEDFIRPEAGFVMALLNFAQKHVNQIGEQLPTHLSVTYLLPYFFPVVAFTPGAITQFDTVIKWIEELQAKPHQEYYNFIKPHFEMWLSSARARRVARVITRCKVFDLQIALEMLQTSLESARALTSDNDSRKFDFDKSPEQPIPILKLGDHAICTPGNLSSIQGPPKAAKSAVVGAILASTMVDAESGTDTLGFNSGNTLGLAVIHIDTEQSEHDHDGLVRRAYKRAKRNECANWLHSYCVTGMEPAKCWSFLTTEIDKASKQHGGILMVILDGIADFCNDPNDAKECFDLVRKLHKLAIKKECAILMVIHENPGNDTGKTRGHLGSQLDRKAETSLRVVKDDKSGTVTMWAARARHFLLPRGEGQQFGWSTEEKMHVTLSEEDDDFISPKPDKESKYREEVTKSFGDYSELSYRQLVERIVQVVGVAKSTAKLRIPEYLKLGLIEKNPNGKYSRVGQIAQSASAA